MNINGTLPSQLKQKGFYVVRFGNKSEQLPNKIEEQMGQDGGSITTPPRLNGEEGLVDLFCGDCSFEEGVRADDEYYKDNDC